MTWGELARGLIAHRWERAGWSLDEGRAVILPADYTLFFIGGYPQPASVLGAVYGSNRRLPWGSLG